MKFTFGNLPSIGWQEPTGRLVELAQRAQAAGFDRFGVSDWRFYHDCFVVMTACLQATSRLEVESLVTDPFVRHPSLTALAHATMDDLSHGRAILGIGAGVEQPTFWGYDRARPREAAREAAGGAGHPVDGRRRALLARPQGLGASRAVQRSRARRRGARVVGLLDRSALPGPSRRPDHGRRPRPVRARGHA